MLLLLLEFKDIRIALKQLEMNERKIALLEKFILSPEI
jgi:hypothetical protein